MTLNTLLPTRSPIRLGLGAFLLTTLTLVSPAGAATLTWTGATSGDWGAANWSEGAFANGSDLVFTGSANPATFLGAANRTINSITFDSSSTTSFDIAIATDAAGLVSGQRLIFQSGNAGVTVAANNNFANTIGVGTKGTFELQGNLTFTHNGSGILKINRAITERNGSFSVTKNGAGTLTFQAGNNAYTGGTIVNQGKLLVNNPGGGTGSGSVTINGDAVLGGSGLIAGATTIQNGATFAPGSSIGTLSFGSTLTLGSASLLSYDLLGTDTTVGSGINDLATGVTALTLDGILNVSESVPGSFLSASPGAQWRLFDYTMSLTDNGLTLGDMPALSDGLHFEIDTTTANQVNLVIMAVPEPSAFTLGAVGLVTLASRYRRTPR